MHEHFGAAEWLAYLDNPGANEQMRGHIGGCEHCAALFSSLAVVRTSMEAGAASARAAVAAPAEIEQMLDRCLAEIRTGSHPRWSPGEALLLLRALLEPICGRGTTGATISLARSRSTGAGANAETLTSRNWNVFISNLSEAMSSICGASAGQLVRRAGFSIALQEG